MWHAVASYCLFGACGPFRDFWKVHSMCWGQLLMSNSHWKKLWHMLKLDRVGPQGITRVGWVWCRFSFGASWHLQVRLGEGSAKEQNSRQSCPFTPCSDASLFLLVCPWCFSSFCPVLKLRVGASMHKPFKRNISDFSNPLFHLEGISTYFHSQML